MNFRSLDDAGAIAHITEALRATRLAEGYEVKEMDKSGAGYFMKAVDGEETTFRVPEGPKIFPMMTRENEEKLIRVETEIYTCCQANTLLPRDIVHDFVEAIEIQRPQLENVYNLAWSRLLHFLFPEK